VEREKGQNFLKTPLTLVLSRKGREEMEGKILKDPLTLALSCRVERGEGGRKEFNGTPHFCSLPQGERRDGRKNF
jgi:hypothetical protein